MERIRLPLFPLCLAILAVAMLLPSLHALVQHDWRGARSFLYAGIFTAFAAAALGVALANRGRNGASGGELAALVACWVLVPVFAAIPLWLRTPQIGGLGAWFEMLAAFTTTGGTVFGDPEGVPRAIHLWRGIVAWLGGLLTLIAAFAILAPRNLGGFELTVGGIRARDGQGAVAATPTGAGMASLDERVARALRTVLPVYGGLTAVLAFIFSALGQGGLDASVHAMAILSTSGVSPHAGGLAEAPDHLAELAAAVFMVLAATRLTYSEARRFRSPDRWHRDPELRLMAALVGIATCALFLRHWFGALSIDSGEQAVEHGLAAFWGAAFTCLSFLTTTGFESAAWHTARDWSGLSNPGLILLGLCAIGGGAATTAGGIKLIRGVTLLGHGYRELERIAQPNSVLASSTRLRGILGESAFLAWAFIMLYSMAVFLAVMALTMTGLVFEDALVSAIAAISNTGPAIDLVAPGEIDFARLSESQRIILAIAMVLGRVEALAVISIFGSMPWGQFSMRTKKTGNARGKASDSRR